MSISPLPDPEDRRPPSRGRTATAAFGSGRRESHDASGFYRRFTPPLVSADETVARPAESDVLYTGDARHMDRVASDSVALVITSPPYFAGKQYEADLGADGVPATYLEYLDLLRDVFAECRRVLEPGGRIAVNVANLGRRPYRSLSGDVTGILSDLGLLLRGEVVWWKGRAAGGSCAWGTFQRPGNPVLRDITERIVIAGKGRFDRALTPRQRAVRGLPSTATISRDEFMEATTDLWELAPESATRVGHPAPFPVELPQRLIDLYTYRDDVVLDPFVGSGSTAVAAVRTGRRYIGFDTDPGYIATATRRIAAEQDRLKPQGTLLTPRRIPVRVTLPAPGPDAGTAGHAGDGVHGTGTGTGTGTGGADPVDRAVREGRQATEVARVLLESCGFTDIRAGVRPRGLGIELTFVADDRTGATWAFDVSGSFTAGRSGLRTADALWRSLGTAAVLAQAADPLPLVLVTTDAPLKGTPGHLALAAMQGPGRPIHDVIELMDTDDRARLARYAAGVRPEMSGSTGVLPGTGPAGRGHGVRKPVPDSLP